MYPKEARQKLIRQSSRRPESLRRLPSHPHNRYSQHPLRCTSPFVSSLPRPSLTHIPLLFLKTPKILTSPAPQGLFLHYHRFFTHLYEEALRDECGYTGTQPYWDWTLNWQDPRQSTVFDGSDGSMGSNGKTLHPHLPTNISAFGIHATIPPGTGGGCIEYGPFANTSVNLGPVAYAPEGPDGGLGYNPRCLTRDLNLGFSNQTKPSDVLKVIEGPQDLGTFDTVLEALEGVHAGGHFTMGGLGIDAFASAGDPAFYLHHAAIDRVWSFWQSIQPEERLEQVYGTGTAFNSEFFSFSFYLSLAFSSLLLLVFGTLFLFWEVVGVGSNH